MDKKGYTLIELIAVIVIIALISTIVILNFDSIFTKSNTKKHDSFKNDLEKAACAYIDLDENATFKSSCYPSTCNVTVAQLVTSGMIADDMIDPTTDNKVSQSLVVRVSWDSSGTKSCTLNR